MREAETSSSWRERRPVPCGRGGVLNGFDRTDHVLRERDEHVQLLVAGAKTELRLVDRETPSSVPSDHASGRSVRPPDATRRDPR